MCKKFGVLKVHHVEEDFAEWNIRSQREWGGVRHVVEENTEASIFADFVRFLNQQLFFQGNKVRCAQL